MNRLIPALPACGNDISPVITVPRTGAAERPADRPRRESAGEQFGWLNRGLEILPLFGI